MKSTIPILMLGLALSATARAGVILEETFTRANGAVVRSTAVSPDPGPANWAGSPGFTALNNTLQSASTNSGGHVLTIDFGVGYFANPVNLGLYTMTADVSFASNEVSLVSTKSWQIGFNNNTNASAGANRSLLSTDTFGGAPALILRADGMAQVKAVNTAAPIFSTPTGTYVAGSVYNLKLELDTRPAAWTVDAFIDNVAIDLNGVNPGTTYTYAANPTIRYVTIASTINATDNTNFSNHLDNFQLSVVPIPEPGTLTLTGLAALGLVVFRRR